MDQLSTIPSMRKRGRIAIVLLLTMLVLAGLLALPWILNRAAIGEAFFHEFEERTGRTLSVETWHIALFPSLRLDLRNVRIQDKPSGTALFAADRLELTLQFLPLWEGRIVGKDVVIDRPRLTVHRSPDGGWALGGTETSALSDSTPQPFAFTQSLQNLLVTDGLVTVLDESGQILRAPVQIQVTQATWSGEMLGRLARLQLSGEIPHEGDRAVFNLDGSVTPSHDGREIQAEGDFRLHRVNLRRFLSAWTTLEPVSDGLVGLAQLTAHLRLSPRSDGYELTTDKWKAELSDIALQGTAGLSGLGGPRPRLSATMSASPVTLERGLSQLPTTWVSTQIRSQLTEHGVDGLFTLQSMELSWPGESGSKWGITGLAEVRNGRFTLQPRYPGIEAFTANIVFDTDQVRLTGLRAQVGPVRLTGEDLSISKWLTDPTIDMRMLGTAPLSGLLEAVRRIDEFPVLQETLRRVQEASGEVDVVVHIMGQPAGGKPLALVAVDLTLQNAGFRGTLFPVFVHQVQARIKASPTTVTLEHMEGRAGAAKLEATGTVTLTEGKAYSDLKLNVTAEASDMLSVLAEQIDVGPRSAVEGVVRMEATLTGLLKQPRFAGTIDLKSAGLRIPNMLTKPRHAPAAIQFDTRLSDGEILAVRHIELLLPPLKIVGDGRVSFSEDMDFSVQVSSGVVSMKQLPRGVALGPIKTGTLQAALHLEGQIKDRASWRAVGQVQFDHGTLKIEAMKEPIRDLFVTLKFDQDTIEIPRLDCHVGDSDFRLSGSIAHWAQAPKARVTVKSSQVELAAFIPFKRGPSTSGAAGKAWWSDGTLEAFVVADHVYYKKFLLTGFSGHVLWDRGVLTVDRISGNTDEGEVAGQIRVREADRRLGRARSSFRVSGIPIERALSLVQENPVIAGWLTTSGKVQTDLDNEGVILSALTSQRPIQVLVVDGRIFNVPVLSELLSVMNLPAVLQGQVDFSKDGMRLDRLKAVFSIDNGMISTKEFLLDSPVLKISATGRYDIMADEFDMVLATSPLGSYAAMLKRIPLFGTLLAGDRQGFDTAMFELKGSAGKPRLKYLPTESLMVGVKGTAQLAFDILVNAITLPEKAYTMISDELGGEEQDL